MLPHGCHPTIYSRSAHLKNKKKNKIWITLL